MPLSFEERTYRLKREVARATKKLALELLAPHKMGIIKLGNPINTIGPSYKAVRVAKPSYGIEVLRTAEDLKTLFVQMEEQPLDFMVRVYYELARKNAAITIMPATIS